MRARDVFGFFSLQNHREVNGNKFQYFVEQNVLTLAFLTKYTVK